VSTAGQKKIARVTPPRHATIRDVARAVGVSETTVSLAFQPNSRISPETRERVLAIGNQLHYVPNSSAQNLRLGKSNAIGFMVNDITNPFYSMMVREAETIAQNRGYQVIFADGHWSASRELRAIEGMIRSRVQGVLLCPCEKTQKSFELLSHYRVPCVVVDTAPEWYRGSFIGNNLPAAGLIAAEHLMEIGCRRPALLTAERQRSSFSSFQAIKRGFLDALGQGGVDPSDIPVIHAGLTIDQGRFGFESLLRRNKDIDGVLCMNDLAAIGVMEAADSKGIQVGRQLAVVGIDDLEISRTPRISLTSVRQPYQRIVEFAVNAIIDRIETQEETDARMFLDPELIVRDSTRRRPS